MKLDCVFHGTLRDAAEAARRYETSGVHGIWSLDTGHNPFMPLLLAAEHTTKLELGTGVAVALARSPMTLAQEAWDLAGFSGGRFMLGLGSQVKAHIVRRFSMPWVQPVAQMREMIGALRAIWNVFQNGGALDFAGDYYKLSLMTPFFSPGPIEKPAPAICLAGVGPKMTELAGEVADGYMLHPFTNTAYFEDVTLPALQRGLAKSGRSRSDFQIVAPAFLILGNDQQQARYEAKVREQIAFYGSTPAYREVLEAIGQGSLADELHKLSRAQQWPQMAGLIPDEVVAAFSLRSTLGDLAPRLLERFGRHYDRLVVHFDLPADETDSIRRVADELERAPVPAV
jgi:probable F420-dependent oxidoreductase